MQMRIVAFFLLYLMPVILIAQPKSATLPGIKDYLIPIKNELVKEWPNNRTINLVFHGHSVPSGYFKTPVVNTMDAYPYQVLRLLKEKYPYSVINVINTAIDYGNLNFVFTPSKLWYFSVPTTRSARLPNYPVDPIGIAPHVELKPEIKDPIQWLVK